MLTEISGVPMINFQRQLRNSQTNLLHSSNQIRDIHHSNSKKLDATGQRESDNITARLQLRRRMVSYGSGLAHTLIMTNSLVENFLVVWDAE